MASKREPCGLDWRAFRCFFHTDNNVEICRLSFAKDLSSIFFSMHVKRQCIGDGVRTAQMSTERSLHQCTKTRLCHSCTPVEPLTNLASRVPQRSENASLEKTIVEAGGYEDLFPVSNCVDPIEDGGLWTASSARLSAEDVEKAAALSNRDTHFTSKSGTTYCFGMVSPLLPLPPISTLLKINRLYIVTCKFSPLFTVQKCLELTTSDR